MFKRALMFVCCTLLFGIFSAKADAWNKKTVVTFSQPVELPGIVLPAGTYVFKLLDSLSDRHIVQVFSEDETKIFTTILAIPNYRLDATGETVLRFEERPKAQPDALRAWFYPGDTFGQEFVYPKTRAVTLAEETKAPVLAAAVTPEENAEELVKAPVETIAPPEEKAAVEPTPLWTAPERVVEPEPAPLTAPAVPETTELPKTATSIPLIALLGASSMAMALLLKRIS